MWRVRSQNGLNPIFGPTKIFAIKTAKNRENNKKICDIYLFFIRSELLFNQANILFIRQYTLRKKGVN